MRSHSQEQMTVGGADFSMSFGDQMHQVRLTGKSQMVLPAPSSNSMLTKLTPIEELAWQVKNQIRTGKKMNVNGILPSRARRVNEDGIQMLEKRYQEKDAQDRLQTMQNRVRRL